MDRRAVAKRLGEPDCRASVPLTQAQLLELARRGGDPNVEDRPEWAKIVAELLPGDELRLINCVPSRHNIFFAHIRNGVILSKMYTVILD
jgi:hypothetical protein